MDTKTDATSRLSERLEEAARLRAQAKNSAAASKRRALLREWQAQRLARTHADLLDHPKFDDAAQFFLTEIYGAKDMTQRDADVARVAPTLARFLPESGVETVADAVELDALSENLDAAMVEALGPRINAIDAAAYGAAYRAVGRRGDRERQVDLIAHLGHALDHLTRRAFAGTALKLMRKPAELAGFTDLQVFLETGFNAFSKMGKAGEFLRLVIRRERAILEGLFDGNDRLLTEKIRI